MKKLSLILLTIVIAAPLSSLISASIDSLTSILESLEQDYNDYSGPFLGAVLAIAIYEFLIYLVVGIPVTLVIDFVTKKIGWTNGFKDYIFQFILYSLSILIPAYILNSNEFWGLLNIGIAVHTYFHLLYFLRLRCLK